MVRRIVTITKNELLNEMIARRSVKRSLFCGGLAALLLATMLTSVTPAASGAAGVDSLTNHAAVGIGPRREG
jgi:hypothetical protein